MPVENIERLIVIGLITSDDYFNQIESLIHPKYFESSMAKRLALWCINYFQKYRKAPGKEIQLIFEEKKRKGLPEDIAEDIEDILLTMSEEYENKEINIQYLVDQTKEYFTEKLLLEHKQKIENAIKEGDLLEAQNIASSFHTPVDDTHSIIDFSSTKVLDEVTKAFNNAQKPIIKYPGALGDFWNEQFYRGAFIALLAPEKRGKSFYLMDLARRAVHQKNKVIFFQAGDMDEYQQIRRFGINLARKSDKEKYCSEHYQPTKDCIFNQLDNCNEKEREYDYGVFENKTIEFLRNEVTYEDLEQAYKEDPNYKPCYNCAKYKKGKIGAVWLEKVSKTTPLKEQEVKQLFSDYFIDKKRSMILSTHPNGTLTVDKMHYILDLLAKDGFIPDLIILDYADLVEDSKSKDERSKQNNVWRGLRRMSQERRSLVVTVTQSDAMSYDTDLLKLKNFSEDKRKYAHVTAMYGMNQDHKGREKKLGILRLNELLLREGGFETTRVVHVLQNLRRGQFYTGSFY